MPNGLFLFFFSFITSENKYRKCVSNGFWVFFVFVFVGISPNSNVIMQKQTARNKSSVLSG